MALTPVINQPAVDPKTGCFTVPWFRYVTDGGAGSVQNAGTVAQLPASPTTGLTRYVSDSSVTTWGATVAGGGSSTVLVWFNGSAWSVVGA